MTELRKFVNGEFRVHDSTYCRREVHPDGALLKYHNCVFHNPSTHKMRQWPMLLRETRLVERMCDHYVGHPDPDSVAWFDRRGMPGYGVHGCDGCCGDKKEIILEPTPSSITISRADFYASEASRRGHEKCGSFCAMFDDSIMEAWREFTNRFGPKPPTKVAVRFVPSSSKKGTTYEVTTFSDGSVTCNCISGKIRKSCKHTAFADKSAVTTIRNAPRA